MAAPQPTNPHQVFLGVYTPASQELAQILADGAEEAERLLPKVIEQHGHTLSGRLKASQILLVLKEIRAQQAALWGDMYPVLKKGISDATLAAAGQVAEDAVFGYLRRRGTDIPAMRAAIVAQARAGLGAVLAKGVNGIPLATSVYRSQSLAQGWVDRKVKSGLLLGRSSKDIAKSVKDLIRPDVKGGVAYAAFRLARTEINNAYHTHAVTMEADKPWNTGVDWHLSRSHPVKDECDLLVGHHAKGSVPDKPHPQCFCYVTPTQVGEDDWIDNFLAGDYNDYIDEKIYTHLPRSARPC